MAPKEILRQFVQDKLLAKGTKIEDDTALFEDGYIDSFNLVELIVFMEKTFGFKFAPLDISLDNLGTLDKMAAYAAGRLKTKG